MKKTFLLRLLTILLLAMASLIIKSETRCSASINISAQKNIESEIINQHNQFPSFPQEEGFLIKI